MVSHWCSGVSVLALEVLKELDKDLESLEFKEKPLRTSLFIFFKVTSLDLLILTFLGGSKVRCLQLEGQE